VKEPRKQPDGTYSVPCIVVDCTEMAAERHEGFYGGIFLYYS